MQGLNIHSRALRLLAALLVAAFMLPGLGASPALGDSPVKPGPVKPAPLTNQVITGSPITITVEDSAQLDITYGGVDQHQFYSGDADGVYLWVNSGGVTKVFGPEWVQSGNGANPYEVMANTLSGTGSSSDPYLVTTVVDVPGTPLRFTQRVTYVNGAEFVGMSYELQQIGATAPLRVTLFHAADLLTAGKTDAYGYYDSATGGVGDMVTTTTGYTYQQFVPNSDTPATAYQEGNSHTIWDAIGDDMTGPGPGLNNTIMTTLHNSGAALQWNITVPVSDNITVGDKVMFSTQPGSCGRFNDVSSDAYYYDYVRYLTCNGIVSGYADGSFHPTNTATRAQLSKMVVLARGWEIDTSGGPHFTDVPDTNIFYPYIETAYHHGVIAGYPDRTFHPASNVTRGQTTKMVVVAMGWGIDTTGGPHFVDVPATNPFYIYIETALHHGIISGYDDDMFLWGNNVIRSQMSKILYLAIN